MEKEFGIVIKNKHSGMEAWCYDVDGEIFRWDSRQQAEEQVRVWKEDREPVSFYYVIVEV